METSPLSASKKLSIKAFDELPDAFIVDSLRSGDSRGSFARLFCDHELSEVLGDRKIVQINHSITKKKGTVRGLHFQKAPHAEMKFVRCLRGQVWDVVVDLRPQSSTYLRWEAVDLTPEPNRMVIIPEGFAHGFQTRTEDCELLYLHTAHFASETEGGLRWDDPTLNIDWPLPMTEVSDRDKKLPLVSADFRGIIL